jgi:hypothetical protein
LFCQPRNFQNISIFLTTPKLSKNFHFITNPEAFKTDSIFLPTPNFSKIIIVLPTSKLSKYFYFLPTP